MTEDLCVPILENLIKFNLDFFCGYSPERINPGDKKHTITNIMKITSEVLKKQQILLMICTAYYPCRNL